MKFVPEDKDVEIEIPYFNDVAGKSSDGWSGHTVSGTVGSLLSKISAAIGRLGGMITNIQRGDFEEEDSTRKRQAMIINFTIPTKLDEPWPGKIAIAALPVKRGPKQKDEGYLKAKENSMKMALYMLLTALQGSWNLRILSPDTHPLLPWMLADKNNTMSQRFEIALTQPGITNLLPEPIIDDQETLEGEFKESS